MIEKEVKVLEFDTITGKAYEKSFDYWFPFPKHHFLLEIDCKMLKERLYFYVLHSPWMANSINSSLANNISLKPSMWNSIYRWSLTMYLCDNFPLQATDISDHYPIQMRISKYTELCNNKNGKSNKNDHHHHLYYHYFINIIMKQYIFIKDESLSAGKIPEYFELMYRFISEQCICLWLFKILW